MGGLFGVVGMVIGVPIFSVIIHIINTYTMNALLKKGLRPSIKDYYVGHTEKIEVSKGKKSKENIIEENQEN